MLKHKSYFLIVILMLLLSSFAWAEENQTEAKDYFPLGDKVAGKAAFKRLECNRCHAVMGQTDWAPSTSGVRAPVLGNLKESSMDIAVKIIAPSHSIAPDFGKEDPETVQKSDMPHFEDTMTVSDLKNLVSYLRSL